MALKDEHHQQLKRIKTSPFSSRTSENPQSVPRLLPFEIIVEILTRLPVKSLLRFRSVCKLWCFIISDPRFIKSHLTNFSTTIINRRLIFPTAPILSIKSCPLNDVLQDRSVNKALDLDYPLKHPFQVVSILGSCNGLLLIANKYDGLLIWNPITRRLIRLPHCRSEGRPIRQSGWYDIGYDESTDDYKVVAISCIVRDQERYDTIVKIYSLKTGNLLQFGTKLVVYDSKNCSFSEIQNFNERLEACTFVESLVSPAGPTVDNQV